MADIKHCYSLPRYQSIATTSATLSLNYSRPLKLSKKKDCVSFEVL